MKCSVVIWQIDLFDRWALTGWRIRRQNLFMNPDTGELTWRNVKA